MPGISVLIPYRSEAKVQPYVAAARAAGMEPTAFSVSSPIAFNGHHALILMGGTDVNPSRYAQSPKPETDPPDDERDEVELGLLSEALMRNKPILAICRGLQLLNVHQGGTLIQHLNLPKHDPELADKAAVAHKVAFQPDSRLAAVAQSATWGVNSRHHQAVAQLGAGLRISARDPADNIIEAIESPGKAFVVGVQWHPEDQIFARPEHLKLFQHFAVACR